VRTINEITKRNFHPIAGEEKQEMGANLYYTDKLSAERLKRCYDLASERTKQYLNAEIDHALEFISHSARVLELGCGYGRILERVLVKTESVIGIDTSFDNLTMAKMNLNMHLVQMDARTLGFSDNQFDVLLCLQNGISAFKIDPIELMRESIRVTRHGGVCLFSSYSHKFWNDRLEWFQLQSKEGLLGEIDYTQTKDGTIACKDGFISTSFGPQEFAAFTEEIGVNANIVEIDESSIFCEVHVET